MKEMFSARRKKLLKQLENGCVALIYSGREIYSSLDAAYPFYPDNQYRYLTGLDEPEGVLVLYKDRHGKADEILFLPEINPDQEKWTGIKLRPEEARVISGIETILPRGLLNESFKEILSETDIFAADKLQHRHQKFVFEDSEILAMLETKELYDLSAPLHRMRLLKEDWEIKKICEAIEITKKGLYAILDALHPGMYEYQVAALFEYTVKKAGAELSFPTICASGENGPILHYETNRKKLKPGTLLLLDLGARLDGYCADISRTYPVSGKFSTEQKKFYDIVLEVEEEMIDNYRVGVSLVQLQQTTCQLYEKKLKKAGISLSNNGIKDWYYHSIGHSLGMDTHDGVSRDLVLEAGMVITCEPGLYLQEKNLGIRIEDDIYITEKGPVNLSRGIAKTPSAIKKLMK